MESTFPQLLDRAEAAQTLRISLRKLDALLADKEIAPTRIGGRVLISMRELERYVAANTAIAPSALAEATA